MTDIAPIGGAPGGGRRVAALLLMVASGAAGLGYQVVWTQQCALWLGHETAAVLAVVAAFFAGLAIGAYVLGRRIEASLRPMRWYAGCEALIGAWGLLLALVMAPLSGLMLRLTGAEPTPAWQWSVAFAGVFFVLLPATAAMGATLPAMTRAAPDPQQPARAVATLYAANTLGAVLGVLATALWLLPAIGLRSTTIVCAALNVACAITAPCLWQTTTPPFTAASQDAVPRPALALLALTGFLGIGYEVIVVRVLSQVTEDTVYTFAILLAVYLVGSAAGAAAWRRARLQRSDVLQRRDRLLCAAAIACLVGATALWGAEAVISRAAALFGSGMPAALAAEALVALLAFGPPTVVMGALFSQLSTESLRAGAGFGRVLAANTLGAAAAPLVIGVVLYPLLGPRVAVLLLASAYVLPLALRRRRSPLLWVPLGMALALAILMPPLAFIDLPEEGRLVSYREGTTAAVSVVEDAEGVATLRINNRQQEGSSATLHVDGRQAWLPLLLHPDPQRVLFLGLGTGMTASAAAMDRRLDVQAVELLPEVIEASMHFRSGLATQGSPPPLRVTAADARRFVRTTDARYDVIIADNFHPARSGSGALYTVEHFLSVRERLEPGGFFCQWLPLHQLDLDTLRSIVQSFLAAFPRGGALLASNSLETPVIGLVGRADDAGFDADAVDARVRDVALPTPVRGMGLLDSFDVLGSFVAGPSALRHFAGGSARNTDDRPVVAYRAPRVTYAPDSLPRDRLVALLRDVSPAYDELLAPGDARGFRPRLSAYWRARDAFILAGLRVRPASDVATMLAQVRDPLLGVLAMSADFRPAYEPLLQMALAEAGTDPHAARELLGALARLQPARPEAPRALHELAASGP